MYDGFFNLKKKPFKLNADPEFFFNSAIHKRAIAYMRYGLIQGEGFVVIIGTPGLGKTMLVKELVTTLNNKDIIIGVMVSSQIGAEDTLRIISAIFGLPYDGHDKATLLAGIERFIKEAAQDGKRILLIVDEAQNLPKQSLEELRMISNFEMSGKIVFQIFLVGQNQLRKTIFSPDMQQLKQRIVSTFQLEPLSANETKKYILFRLEKAGWNHKPEFDDNIFPLIHKYSEGIPRRINTLCDRILLFAYLSELEVIAIDSVEKVIAELEEEMSSIVVEEDNNEASSPALKQYEGDGSLEDRVIDMEKKLLALQKTVVKEKTLLRKAVLLQLDMDEVYDETK